MRKKISIIIPVYNEEACLGKLWDRLDSLQKRHEDYEFDFVFVNDGSHDSSLSILKALAKDNKNVKIISFARNFGHDIALTAGTDHVSSDAVVFMDADLQDPPDLIDEMLLKFEEGFDVVYAVRRQRKGESLFKIKTAEYFYRLLNSISYVKIPSNTSNFRLISKKVLQSFQRMPEKDRFVRGMISWIGFRQCPIFFDRDPRYAGETKYNLKKMVGLAVNGLVSFSHAPLRFGIYSAIVLLIMSVIMFVAFLFENKHYLTISAIFFVGAVQLFAIGIIGEYLIRVFNEARGRPLYVIDEKINMD